MNRLFFALFHKHDATKRGSYRREKESGLGYEDFKKVFSHFCFYSFFRNQFEFSETAAIDIITKSKAKIYSACQFESVCFLNDLTKVACMLVREGLNYHFSHRSFQEYFAAVYTMQLGDKEQKQLLSLWLKESSRRMTSDYLEMLLELQPERFIQNVLYEPIYDLRKDYVSQANPKEWAIRLLYSEVTIRTLERSGEERIGFMIRNTYEYHIVELMRKYLKYQLPSTEEIAEKRKGLITVLKKEYGDRCRGWISFEELDSDGHFNQLVEVLDWIPNMFDFAFRKIDELSATAAANNAGYEAMLEDL